jgi:pimeloyl-ACP methyl ester carboxylesterase
MDAMPTPHYTRTDDGVHIAYTVVGDGPIDLVLAPGLVSHLEWWFDPPPVRRWTERLASFARLILLDKRGTGLSDRVESVGDLDRRILDLKAVLDAVGCPRAAVFGVSEGGSMAALLAASEPERVSALVLYGAWARVMWAPDYPEGITQDDVQATIEHLEATWGEGADLRRWMPSAAGDPSAAAWWARAQRMAMSPSGIAELTRAATSCDVRAVLPLIRVPTLVLHKSGDRIVPVAQGRYVGNQIPGARYVELPGADHIPFWDDPPFLLDEIEEFLTGTRPGTPTDRRLATVVITDICGSTARLSEVGDQQWHRTLDELDAMVRRQTDRSGGRVVKTLGDGALMTFDGPSRAIRCAQAIRDGATAYGLEVRVGVHTGEIEVRDDDVAGIAVHLAARVSAEAGPGEVLVSRTVVDLIAGSGISLQDRGHHELKGIEGTWQLFAAG